MKDLVLGTITYLDARAFSEQLKASFGRISMEQYYEALINPGRYDNEMVAGAFIICAKELRSCIREVVICSMFERYRGSEGQVIDAFGRLQMPLYVWAIINSRKPGIEPSFSLVFSSRMILYLAGFTAAAAVCLLSPEPMVKVFSGALCLYIAREGTVYHSIRVHQMRYQLALELARAYKAALS